MEFDINKKKGSLTSHRNVVQSSEKYLDKLLSDPPADMRPVEVIGNKVLIHPIR